MREDVRPQESRGGAESGPEGLLPLREASGGAESDVVDDAAFREASLYADREWAELSERLLRVRCPSGARLLMGPGDFFPVLEELPLDTVVTAPPRPPRASAPGWVWVEAEMFHGQGVRGFIEESLLEEIDF